MAMAARSRESSRDGFFFAHRRGRYRTTVSGAAPGRVAMATTTQGDQQLPGGNQVVQRSHPPAGEVLAGSDRPVAQAAGRTSEKARSGRHGPPWVKTVLRWLLTVVLIAIAALAYLVWRIASTEALPE